MLYNNFNRNLFLKIAIIAAFLLASSSIYGAAEVGTGEINGDLRQITNELYSEYQPRIDGDIVVFTAYSDGSENIFYIDLITGVKTQITQAPCNQRLADVSGHRIAYTEIDLDPDIYIYDIDKGGDPLAIDEEGVHRNWPAIDGDLLAYTYKSNNGGSSQPNIKVRNLKTGETKTITDNEYFERWTTISGSMVAFERISEDGCQIILYNLDTEEEIVVMSEASAQLRPHIHGDWLVFDAFVDGREVRDLILYQISTHTIHHLEREGEQSFARISGNWLVFEEKFDATDETEYTNDIILFDMITGASQRITSPENLDFLSDIDGNKVVFTSKAEGKYDIWLYEFDAHTLNLTVEGEGDTTPAPGTYLLANSSEVELTASPKPGWEFSHWTVGVENYTEESITIQMNDDKSVSAKFKREDEDDASFESLEDQVQDLLGDGTLNRGQGRALLATLSAANRNLDRGNTQEACNILEAFINQVEAFMKAGIVQESEGQALISEAQNLIEQIPCEE